MTSVLNEDVQEVMHAKQAVESNNTLAENMVHIETAAEENLQKDEKEMKKEETQADTPRDNNSCHACETNGEDDCGSEIMSEDDVKSLSANNKMDSEGKETHIEDSYVIDRKKGVEFEKLHNLHDDGDVSRTGSISSSSDKNKVKKKTRILSKFKIHSYLHKSYDKVSHALIKTSKSILKSGQTHDYKSDKPESTHNSEMLTTLNSDDLNVIGENLLTEDELCLVHKYLADKKDIDEKNKEILNEFNLFLEKKDSSNFMNELNDLLDERKLLIKSVNHFKHLSKSYNSCLEKYKDSYYILKLENEQLNENIKTLKSCIDAIHIKE